MNRAERRAFRKEGVMREMLDTRIRELIDAGVDCSPRDAVRVLSQEVGVSSSLLLAALGSIGGKLTARDLHELVGGDLGKVRGMLEELAAAGYAQKAGALYWAEAPDGDDSPDEGRPSESGSQSGQVVPPFDVNALLDRLVPGGFKARHLPAIEAWKAATANLIEAVSS